MVPKTKFWKLPQIFMPSYFPTTLCINF